MSAIEPNKILRKAKFPNMTVKNAFMTFFYSILHADKFLRIEYLQISQVVIYCGDMSKN